MKKALILTSCLFAATFACAVTAAASEPVTLSFNRTGTTAGDVTVSVSGAEGATATVTSVSHSLKALSNAAILCPDINGNTSPTIELGISVSGLPSDFRFDAVGLHIHALNAAGSYQQNNDGKARQYNVAVNINGNEFAQFDNIDIAANVPSSHKNWEAEADNAVTASSPLAITLQITAGTANLGCFFGLESISLTSTEGGGETPDPDPIVPPVDPSGSKFYTIKWKNNTSSYMTEQADGGIVIGDYATFNKVFWEFIPTDKENCFYIRNTASGNYIGSCNMTPSSASLVKMSKTPVEYYVHLSSSSAGENAGCYWLSSTDCDGYSSESNSPRALNKDGASQNIITWTAAVANIGSYWTLTETENLYEVRPFAPSPAIGQSAGAYHILSPDGKAYTTAGTWSDMNPIDKSQQWYFVGTSNSNGGYQIVNLADNAPINEGKTYKVAESAGSSAYNFLDAEGNKLLLGDVADLTFSAARSQLALDLQIYKMPCGTKGTVYIKKATIGADYHYPMGHWVNNRITYSSASMPTDKYVMLTRDAATVVPGTEASVTLTFNRIPGDYVVTLYFDWDRDGYFEASQPLTTETKDFDGKFEIPATAKTGKTRMRIRLTDNGLTGADDDTHGEVLDLMLNVINESADLIEPTVKVNDAARGTAAWANGTASATAAGNSTFLYWAEGHRILSVDADYAVEASPRQRVLTAFFTPNTQEMDGIDEITLSKTDSAAKILFDGTEITVESAADVKAIVVFAVNGAKVAGTVADTLSVSGIAQGVYIVKAITANGVASAKIKI